MNVNLTKEEIQKLRKYFKSFIGIEKRLHLCAFISFLDKFGVLEEFLHEKCRAKASPCFCVIEECDWEAYFVRNAFEWACSTKGHSFWNNIDSKWKYFIVEMMQHRDYGVGAKAFSDIFKYENVKNIPL